MLNKEIWLAFFLAATCLCSANAQSEAGGESIVVNLAGDDGLSQKLSADLKAYVADRPGLRIASDVSSSSFMIKSDDAVTPDVIDGVKILIYDVSFVRNGKTIGHILGACKQSDVRHCAKTIVDRYMFTITHARKGA